MQAAAHDGPTYSYRGNNYYPNNYQYDGEASPSLWPGKVEHLAVGDRALLLDEELLSAWGAAEISLGSEGERYDVVVLAFLLFDEVEDHADSRI